MPYLLLKGTQCQVVTPGGRSIDHYICRHTTLFTDAEADRGLHMRFSRAGYMVIVSPSDVVTIEIHCLSCGQTVTLSPYCRSCADLRGER